MSDASAEFAVGPLVAQLQDDDASRRAEAAEQLAQRGDEAQRAAPALVEAAGDDDEAVREWAVGALESLGAPHADDLPALAALLADARLDVAYWAATLLGRLAGQGGGAAKPLTDALANHPETSVRERAAWALGKIGPKADVARAALAVAAAGDGRLARLARQALESLDASEGK